MTTYRALIVIAAMACGGAGPALAQEEADYAAAIENWSNGDFSTLDVIDACAETVPVCAATKGEGLSFGEGWEEDIEAALRYLTFAAEAGDAMAMTNLAYIYDEPDTPEFDGVKAANWYGRAVMASEPGVEQSGALQDFYFQDMEQALAYQAWRDLPLGEPRFRKSYGMGYYSWDKPSVPDEDMAAMLAGAAERVSQGQLELFDEFNVRKGVAMTYAQAYLIYADMLERGVGVTADPELAETYRKAAKTWE